MMPDKDSEGILSVCLFIGTGLMADRVLTGADGRSVPNAIYFNLCCVRRKAVHPFGISAENFKVNEAACTTATISFESAHTYSIRSLVDLVAETLLCQSAFLGSKG